MATATSLSAVSSSGRRVKNAYDSVAASQTDSILVAAIANRVIRVVAVFANNVDAGTGTFTFKTKGAGAGTVISPAWQITTKSGFVLPVDNQPGGGWFETLPGEALAIDTAGASATNVLVVYETDTVVP